MASHERDTLEEVHEDTLGLEREAANARHRIDYRLEGGW